MRHFLHTILMLFCMSCPAISQAADEVEMDARLIGSWSAGADTPSGEPLRTAMTLSPDATFSGTAELNGKIGWTYSRTLALQQDSH